MPELRMRDFPSMRELRIPDYGARAANTDDAVRPGLDSGLVAIECRSGIEHEIARAMQLARRSTPGYLRELRRQLGWPLLSRQTVHHWETGTSRVPASALLVAAALSGLTVDDLLENARRSLALEEAGVS